MALNLPSSVSSRQDLKSVTLEVRQYAKWYGETAIKLKVAGAKNYEQPVFTPAATQIISEWNQAMPINQKSLEELIYSLEDLAVTLPHMTITLAAPAPGSLKKTLIAWCRQNIDPNVLIDFAFNSTMLGGMVVQFGSHIHDWSFRKQILDARVKFPEVLRNV